MSRKEIPFAREELEKIAERFGSEGFGCVTCSIAVSQETILREKAICFLDHRKRPPAFEEEK